MHHEPEPPRCFTVEEANDLLPVLDAALRRVEDHREEIGRRHAQLQVLDLLWGERLLDPGSPDHAEAAEHRGAIVEAAQAIERLVEREILGRGVRFPPGGLEHGLLDFPTRWEGRWVYLCWRRGEPALAAWHEIHAGFAGRRPLTADHARRMGR